DISRDSVWLTGNSQFTVNFKNKTLKGTVDQWHDYVAFAANQVNKKVSSVKPVEIDAQIRANTFAGTANKTGTVEGKFYGPNAANLAGAFNDKEQKMRGVFGAVKQ
ncbi:MAG: transferrin-binding protein-like solute binding protein, partial [Neisseriaceae bacterium]|nr:transferrin-binding protein-like solute binding protein [Neisseriaceae bacterium]